MDLAPVGSAHLVERGHPAVEVFLVDQHHAATATARDAVHGPLGLNLPSDARGVAHEVGDRDDFFHDYEQIISRPSPESNAACIEHAQEVGLQRVRQLADLVAAPETSLVLTMPSAEDPPDAHPNVTFTGPRDPDYLKLLVWIREGALQN